LHYFGFRYSDFEIIIYWRFDAMGKDVSLSVLLTVTMMFLFMGLFPVLLAAQEPGPPKGPLTERQMSFMALRLGDELLHRKMLPEAISQFTLAVKLQPEEAISHQRLGDALLKVGKIREALKEYEVANRLKPLFPPTYLGRGMAYSRLFETEKAISLLKEGLKLDPKFAPLYFELGLAYAREDHLQEAIKAIETGLGLDPRGKPLEEMVKQLKQELEWEAGFLTLTGEHFTVKYHSEQDKAFVESVLNDLEISYAKLSQELQFTPPTKIFVKVYPDLRWFQQAASTPEWFKRGVAKSRDNKILLATPKLPGNIERLPMVLAHELTHIFIDLMTNGNRPGWLNEGMALSMSGEVRDTTPLVQALPKGDFIPLKKLEEPFLRTINDPGMMHLAYAESYLAVQVLVEKNGRDRLVKFLRFLSDGEGFEEALSKSFGEDYASLEEKVKKYALNKTY
jgi:tetratricopeptide (TPR) repeat protein